MSFHSSGSFEEIFVAGFVVCLLLSEITIYFMTRASNRRLAKPERLSHLLSPWNQISGKYRQLYPTGHANSMLMASIFSAACFAIGGVVVMAWQALGAK
jgi:hypothetical protein